MTGLPFHQARYPLDTYRPGYPRFAALLSTHPAFQNFRRFTRARMRLLLLKQDEICSLEAGLDKIDAQEQRNLFLGCARGDENPERRDVFLNLKGSLAEYDIMLEKYNHVLSLPKAGVRDIGSIKNWIDGTGCIARKESEYLEMDEDMLNLTGPQDGAVTRIEAMVEDCVVWLGLRVFKRIKCLPNAVKPGRRNLSKDQNIFLLGSRLRAFSRMMTAWMVTIVLLIPVIVLFCISSPLGRLITIIFAAGLFLSTVSMLTKARTMEIFMAGATYAAVLVVFTSANNAFDPKSPRSSNSG